MSKINVNFSLGLVLFIIGLLTSVLIKVAPNTNLLLWLLLLISVIYLFTGWYVFKVYYPEGNLLIRILMGYLYASIFVTMVIIGFGLPLLKIFVVASMIWIIAQILILIILRNHIPKKGMIQFSIEAFFLLILVLYSVCNNL